MKKILQLLLFVFVCSALKAQLPSNTFLSRNFNGNTKAQWILLDSPVVNPILDTFYARYPGTQIVRIQGGDTSLWFYGGNRRWFRSLQAPDTISLSNRIDEKLNITDTTGKWMALSTRLVDTIYRVNDSTIAYTINGTEYTFEILGRSQSGGGGGSGTVTSVALSMPSAFTVSGSPITSSGTFSVNSAGTSQQYIRGNGTLATMDTTAIPNFYSKVRGLLSNTSPIQYNNTTGVISVLDATEVQKGVASFNASDFTVSSASVSLSDVVTAGNCTNCDFSVDSKGRIVSYSTGTSSGITSLNGLTASVQVFDFGNSGTTPNFVSSVGTHTLNIPLANQIGVTSGTITKTEYDIFNNKLSDIQNVGVGFRWRMPPTGSTANIRTVYNSNTVVWDSTSNIDGLTARVDTSREIGIPSYHYVDSLSESSTGSINDSIADLSSTWSSQYIIDNSRLFINPYSKEAVAFGDSYTDPTVEISTADKMWINLFSMSAGIPINNQAASGGGVVEMFNRAINNLPKTNNYYSGVTLTGFNDNIRGGMNQKELDKIYSGYMAFLANFYLSTAVPVSASAVTKYGTWSTLNGGANFPLKAATLSSGSGRSNTNTNDSLVWTFTGPTCVVGFINSDDTAVGFTMGDFEVFIDNVSHGTYTGNNKALHVQDSWWSNKYSNNAVVLFNLGTGTHKLKIVHKDDNPLYIDYFGTLVSAKEGMNILVGTIPKIGPDGYALRNVASVVTTDTANAYILRAIRNFTSQGYPIAITDVNRYYTLAGVSSDNIHPNDLGNRQLANAFLSKIANIPPMGISYNSVGTDGEIYTIGENAYYNTSQGLSKIDTALGAQVMFFDNRTSTTLSTGLFNMQPGNSGTTSYIFRALKDGKFGIGTSSSNDATRKLDVNGDARIRATLHVGNATEPSFTPVGSITSFGDNNRNGYTSYVYSGSTNRGTSINSFFARGTMASPAATQAGDRMMGVGGTGYTGSSYPDSSNSVIMFVASENYGPANQGGYITFITTPNGATVVSRSERARITSNGSFLINSLGGNANIDQRRLYVNGSVGISDDSTQYITAITTQKVMVYDSVSGKVQGILPANLGGIPSFTGLAYNNGSTLSAATIGDLLQLSGSTLNINSAYISSLSNNQLFLKSRMRRLSYTVPDADFTTLSTRQEGLFELPDITANRNFDLFALSGVDGVEFYIYNGNTSGTFSWSFNGVIPVKGSDGTPVTTIENGRLYHMLGVYVNSIAKWVIVNQ